MSTEHWSTTPPDTCAGYRAREVIATAGDGKLRWVFRFDGEDGSGDPKFGHVVWQFRCPSAAHQDDQFWADVDDDQMCGRVSIQCFDPACDFHETRHLWAEIVPSTHVCATWPEFG